MRQTAPTAMAAPAPKVSRTRVVASWAATRRERAAAAEAATRRRGPITEGLAAEEALLAAGLVADDKASLRGSRCRRWRPGW